MELVPVAGDESAEEIRQTVREAVESDSPGSLGMTEMKAINENLGFVVERERWAENARLLQDGSLLSRLRYLRDTWRWPGDIEDEFEYVTDRFQTAAANAHRWNIVLDELRKYETEETVVRND